jgi:catechol 2,3-dioxygenase-like lactoylglutathione lyase family enzyme
VNIEISKIKETCLYVADLERARLFYHEKLGLPIINYQPEKHLFLRAGESVLLIFNPEDSKTKTSPPPHFGRGNQHFAFEIAEEDYLNAKKKIEALGISIIDEVTWKSGKKSFYFHDPENNVLEILPSRGIWE